LTELIKRQRLAGQQQQRRGAERLRRARQDQKVERLTGVQGFRFRDLVAVIQKEKGLTADGARKNAQTLLDRMGILDAAETKEQQRQWRFMLVKF